MAMGYLAFRWMTGSCLISFFTSLHNNDLFRGCNAQQRADRMVKQIVSRKAVGFAKKRKADRKLVMNMCAFKLVMNVILIIP